MVIDEEHRARRLGHSQESYARLPPARPDADDDGMTTPVRKHLVTILDAPPAVQHWMDAFVAAARTGTGDWPHPHGGIPLTVVPLQTFDDVMTQVGWARAAGGPESTDGVTLPPVPDPGRGGMYHNVLHSLLGDFH
jgi:hypothetical protein